MLYLYHLSSSILDTLFPQLIVYNYKLYTILWHHNTIQTHIYQTDIHRIKKDKKFVLDFYFYFYITLQYQSYLIIQHNNRIMKGKAVATIAALVLSTISSTVGQDLQDFENKCVASVLSENGIDYSSNPENSYVDCSLGFVRGRFLIEPCTTACNGLCCTGSSACVGLTGKGEQKGHPYIFLFKPL